MRNLYSEVPQAVTIHWDADHTFKGPHSLQAVVDLFNDVFDNPRGLPFAKMVPSEKRVIVAFFRYARRCRARRSDYAKDHPGSFVYVNVNTGRPLVFITWYGYGEFAGSSRAL